MTPITIGGHTYWAAGGRVRDVRITLHADPGLVGYEEARTAVLVLSALLGTLLGLWASTVLGGLA